MPAPTDFFEGMTEEEVEEFILWIQNQPDPPYKPKFPVQEMTKEEFLKRLKTKE